MQKTIDDLEDNLHTTKSNLHAIQHTSRIQETKYKDLIAHVEGIFDFKRRNCSIKIIDSRRKEESAQERRNARSGGTYT